MTDLVPLGLRLPPGTQRRDFRVRFNQGRWIVDCAHCTSAMWVKPMIGDHLGAHMEMCWDCGRAMGPIIWPENHIDIVAIVGWRPDETTRNWEPGEDLEDLLRENAEHKIEPPPWSFPAVLPEGPYIAIQVRGDWVTGGVCAPALLEAAARYRPAIGRAIDLYEIEGGDDA